jgi:hypothetical protein
MLIARSETKSRMLSALVRVADRIREVVSDMW